MENQKARILLCEDDTNLGSVLKNYLELNDFEVVLERDGRLGLAAFQREKFDICLLDVMMPHMDGFKLAEEIRDVVPDIPLFFISAKKNTSTKMASSLKLSQLKQEPLILPTGPHGLRTTLDAAFARIKLAPNIVLEIDSLALLMDAVDAGLGATLQPWAAVARFPDAAERFHMARISEANVQRVNVLCSLSEDELSPVALAARVVLKECAQQLVSQGIWTGARVKPSK